VSSKELKAILDIFVESQELDRVGKQLRLLPEVTDLFDVTGQSDIVAFIKTESIVAFRRLLVEKILRIRGIRSTTSAVIIHTHKEKRPSSRSRI